MMAEEYDIETMTAKVQLIKEAATDLLRVSGGIQAIDRNVDRILASVKMLEINTSDVVDIIQAT